jgi:hypothetical protein
MAHNQWPGAPGKPSGIFQRVILLRLYSLHFNHEAILPCPDINKLIQFTVSHDSLLRIAHRLPSRRNAFRFVLAYQLSAAGWVAALKGSRPVPESHQGAVSAVQPNCCLKPALNERIEGRWAQASQRATNPSTHYHSNANQPLSSPTAGGDGRISCRCHHQIDEKRKADEHPRTTTRHTPSSLGGATRHSPSSLAVQ